MKLGTVWKEDHGLGWKEATIKIFNDDKKYEEYQNSLRSE